MDSGLPHIIGNDREELIAFEIEKHAPILRNSLVYDSIVQMIEEMQSDAQMRLTVLLSKNVL